MCLLRCWVLCGVSERAISLYQRLNLVPAVQMAVLLQKERNCQQDDCRGCGGELIEFPYCVVVGDFVLYETTANLLHSAMSVAIKAFPCILFEVLKVAFP